MRRDEDTTTYCIVVIDGPAKGFVYETMIRPARVIALAPRLFAPVPGFFRALSDEDPWPGQCTYELVASTPEDGVTIMHYKRRPGGLMGTTVTKPKYRIVKRARFRRTARRWEHKLEREHELAAKALGGHFDKGTFQSIAARRGPARWWVVERL